MSKVPRKRPNVELSECPASYARLCAYGWDTIQEAHARIPTPEFITVLEAAQAEARAIDEGTGIVCREISGWIFKVSAHGAKRFRYRFENDDVIFFIGVGFKNYGVSVRYTSAGLCEHGWKSLTEFAVAILQPHTIEIERDGIRVSRADWFFDFYAPRLKEEFGFGIAANVVSHSSTKKFETVQTVGVGLNAQTLTIGTRASCQVQLYDKTREIIEASGKEWLYKFWVQGLDGEWPWDDTPDNVFRLEIRMLKEFLRARNCRRPEEVERQRARLTTDALFARRLTLPSDTDSNRRRWRVHPLWSEAIRSCNAPDMVPLGRMVTGRREALADRLERQIGGSIRSLMVLKTGGYDEKQAAALMNSTLARIPADRAHDRKLTRAKYRYSDVDEAR